MIIWKQQGAAVVGEVTLTDGRRASVVVVGATQNEKGAALILPPATPDAAAETLLFPAANSLLAPWHLLEVICMQERCFGTFGLPHPELEAG